MGVVFQAEDPQLERRVALKAMLPALAATASARQRFLREAKAAAAIEHEHIVPIYQVGEDRGVPFLAMQLLKGESLDERLKRERVLPVAEVMRIGRQIAEGLAAAHARGLVHRDVKPANVWLEGDRAHVKILDFGLARPVADNQHLTQSGAIVGTPSFMAPEQVNGQPVDARTDLFSLGCVLYRMATGELPFKGRDMVSTLMAVATEQPRAPHDLNRELPVALSDLIVRLLNKDPDKRPTTASEVARTLARLAEAARAPAAVLGTPTVLVAMPVSGGRAWDAGPDWASITDVSPPRGKAESASWGRGPLVAAVAAIIGALALFAAVAIIHITTDKGELVIETVDPDVQVKVTQGGRQVTIIDPKTQQRVVLPSGDYDVALAGNKQGLRLSADTFTLKRGDQQIVKVTRVFKPAPRPVVQEVGEVRRFDGHTNGAWSVAFSPDGRHAISGSGDGTVRLWEVATGREVRQFSGHRGPLDDVAFSPDGRQALTASWDGAVRLWEVQTGKEIRVLKGHTHYVHRVAFSPDGRCALSGSGEDGTMRLWDLESGNELRRFNKEAVGVAFSPDGRRALSGGWRRDPLVRLWDIDTGAEVRQLRGHTGIITSVVFLPGGSQALSCSSDQTLRLWDLDSGQEIRCFSGHTGPVNRVAITRDGRYAISASADKTVRLWDLQTGKELHCFTGHTEGVIGVAVSQDGKFALSASEDKTVRLWRLPDPPPVEDKVGEIRRFKAETHGILRLALSPDGRRLLTAGNDGTARYWDIATGKEIHRLPGAGGQVCAVAISPDGTKLLGCGEDSLIHVWDAATGKELKQLKGHTGYLMGVAVSPDGRMVVSAGGGDRTLRLWNFDTGDLMGTLEGHTDDLRGVSFSPDGKLIASWGCDKTVRLWDVKDQKEISCLKGHTEMVRAARFSQDGSRLLSGSIERHLGRAGTLILWEVKTGKLLLTSGDIPSGVHGLAISADGRRALSCGGGLLQFWNLESGKEIVAFSGHSPTDTVFLPGGQTALSVQGDGTIRLWRLPDLPPRKDKP
jgi:WD40 repeat protein